MKTLLMVERDGRVVCVSHWPAGSGPKTFEEVQQRTQIGTVADTCWDGRRVWLVEAESAEDAREVIAKFGEYFPVGSSITVPRILASGGRS